MDLVERLRDSEKIATAGLFYAVPVMSEAALEIERLRKVLGEARECALNDAAKLIEDIGQYGWESRAQQIREL